MLSLIPPKFASARTIQRTLRDKQDALVREARALLAQADADAHNEHAERLKRLGFSGTNAVRALEQRRKQADEVRQRVELEEQYAMKYPGFRFVADAVMDAVCARYGLVIGPVERYLGDVPEWAAKAIESSGVMKENRMMYGVIERDPFGDGETIVARGLTKDQAVRKAMHKLFGKVVTLIDKELHIAAPKKLMRMGRNEHVVGNHIVQRDPIVTIPVTGGHIVLAAWDEEGRDPRIINPQQN